MRDTENLDFDSISFDPEENDVELNLHDAGTLCLDLTELNDCNEIPVSVAISPKSTEKIAEDVEEVILNLLEEGDRDSLLVLTGERPDLNSDIDSEVGEDFASMYSQAVIHNPAIKWYSRLTNILPADQFFVQAGQLHIKMPKHTFKKVLEPFLIDFDAKFYETSPLVHLVLNCAEKIAETSLAGIKSKYRQVVKAGEEPGLDVGTSGLESMFDTDSVTDAGAEMRLDDNDALNQSGIREVKSSLNLADLSNKAIASYLVDKGYSETESEQKLKACIADKARRNEISVLVNMARKMNNSPLQHLRPTAMRENPDKDSFKWDD